MSDEISNCAYGNGADDYFNNQVNGNVIVNSVAENGEKHYTGHDADYRGEEITVEAAFGCAPEKAYKIYRENGQGAYRQKSEEVIVKLHVEYFFACLCFFKLLIDIFSAEKAAEKIGGGNLDYNAYKAYE